MATPVLVKGAARFIGAATSAPEAWVGYRPSAAIETGVARFAAWYRDHYPT